MSEIEAKRSKVSMMQLKSQSVVKSQTFGAKSTSRLKVRRQSFGFSGVPGIRPVERTSQIAIEFKRPVLTYLPTYQLDPSYKFHLPTVQKITDELLDEHWTGHKYNVQDSPALALRLAGELMRKLKAVQFNRYRIICVVTIGQKRAQSYNNAVSFLWDHDRDNYVDVQREVSTAFIQVTTFVSTWISVNEFKHNEGNEDRKIAGMEGAYVSARQRVAAPLELLMFRNHESHQKHKCENESQVQYKE